MNGKTLIVFEAQPYWQPELQRRFLNEDVEVVACRSLGDLDQRMRQTLADLVVLDISADVSGSLRWIIRAERSRPVSMLVVLNREQGALKWRIRELGATAVVDEFIGGNRMAAVCRKAWRNPANREQLMEPHHVASRGLVIRR